MGNAKTMHMVRVYLLSVCPEMECQHPWLDYDQISYMWQCNQCPAKVFMTLS